MTQKNGYKTVNLNKNGKMQYFLIHHLVAIAFLNHKVSRAMHIDHIDGVKINNLLSNLQILTHRQNVSKQKRKTSSKYVGVCWIEKRKRWVSVIQINKKANFLGYFKIEKDASDAYQKALNKIKI